MFWLAAPAYAEAAAFAGPKPVHTLHLRPFKGHIVVHKFRVWSIALLYAQRCVAAAPALLPAFDLLSNSILPIPEQQPVDRILTPETILAACAATDFFSKGLFPAFEVEGLAVATSSQVQSRVTANLPHGASSNSCKPVLRKQHSRPREQQRRGSCTQP
jgi:hypothetical protein